MPAGAQISSILLLLRKIIYSASFRFCEFPSPGDAKKQLLNKLVDPDEAVVEIAEVSVVQPAERVDEKEYWMPDRLCKVCYSCEDAFT